jgi:hypothetical protein
MFWRICTFGLIALSMTGCATTMPVNRPCGVISDSLIDVHATTRDGDRRISDHYARGHAAKCW